MKSNLNENPNRYKKNNKEIIFHKKAKISNKINNCNIYTSSSLPKMNKTLKKYINEKLNIKNKKFNNIYQEQNPSRSNPKNKSLLIYKKENISLNQKVNPKSKDKNIKHKNIKEQVYSKKNISKNNFNYSHPHPHPLPHPHNFNKNTENNKSFNCFLKRKQSKKQLKLINSVSTSAGMSSSSNKIEENGRLTNHDYHSNFKNNNSIDKNNITYDKNINKRIFLEESNYCKHKINNFNYETGSDDNLNENIIFLKYDNNSSLTFGNSFTYSNSQRSKSTKKNENVDNISNKFPFRNNNYLNKLKEENETLKKELKESNDQITFLKYKIKELKEDSYNIKKSSRNIMFPTNIWNKKFFKYELLENRNSNSIKEFSLNSSTNAKIKFKKDFIEKLNHTINENNYNCNLYKDNRKLINVKRNLNLKKKIIRNSEDDFSSFCLLDKPCEKITECISNLKI
jgi:hypothetical protein